MKSELEAQFLRLWRDGKRRHSLRLPNPKREFRFCERLWRFDFAWPTLLVAVEIEGAIWVAGRHATGAGILADMEKYNAAAVRGWKVLRFTDKHLRDGDDTFMLIMEAMGAFQED